MCIRASGNVYAYDTIMELNRKAKFWFDLISSNYFYKIDEPFTAEDIITIQDPKDTRRGCVAEFDYLKNNIPFVPQERLQPEIK